MTLKFDKVLPQVQKMGRMIAHQSESISERGRRAVEMLQNADDLALIHEQIALVREKDAGYRGAAPHTEAIHIGYDAPPAPEQATLVAVDGSQIYPDFHATALYYLTNLGIFTYFHGENRPLPEEDSQPFLFYSDTDLRERHGHGSLIKNTVVNVRRDVQELQTLFDVSARHWQEPSPLIGVRDGRLLWWLGGDVPYADQLEGAYYGALRDFHSIHIEKQRDNGYNASLIGYVESDDSRFVIRLLHLLSLKDEAITRAELADAGPFEGLSDGWLFGQFLEPGQRSALMIQQSPQNKLYKEVIGPAFEITFFYLNVGVANKPHIIRIETPMWVADAPGAVDEVHSLILSQCALSGRYPYVLTRADELAVIKTYERYQLDSMINIELLKHDQLPEKSPKQANKDNARAPRRRYGEPVIRR